MTDDEIRDQIVGAMLRGIGDRISECAEKVGGVPELAARIGIDQSQVRRYIRAENKIPVETMLKIAYVAEVRSYWLVTGEQDKTPIIKVDFDFDFLKKVIDWSDKLMAKNNLTFAKGKHGQAIVALLQIADKERRKYPDEVIDLDQFANVIRLAAKD